MSDYISRQAAIEAVETKIKKWNAVDGEDYHVGLGLRYTDVIDTLAELPSAQPPKEISKRVLWSGWKGYRDTRYKCPNCEKPVRNDDAYCHRCGQRLLFPNISFTDYVPGQGHELIVRWDDE